MGLRSTGKHVPISQLKQHLDVDVCVCVLMFHEGMQVKNNCEEPGKNLFYMHAPTMSGATSMGCSQWKLSTNEMKMYFTWNVQAWLKKENCKHTQTLAKHFVRMLEREVDFRAQTYKKKLEGHSVERIPPARNAWSTITYQTQYIFLNIMLYSTISFLALSPNGEESL